MLVLEESMEDYCAIVNVEYLKKSFEQGDMEVVAEYWSQASGEKQVCVRQSFIMTRDDDSGDIIVMVVSKEITEQV